MCGAKVAVMGGRTKTASVTSLVATLYTPTWPASVIAPRIRVSAQIKPVAARADAQLIIENDMMSLIV